MLTLLISLVVVVQGVVSVDLSGVHAKPYADVPLRKQVCCELWADGATDGSESKSGATGQHANQLKCYRNNTTDTPHSSTVVCLNILCWLDEENENLICIRELQSTPTDTLVTISLRHWPAGIDSGAPRGGWEESAGAQCTQDGHTCSVALDGSHGNVSVTVNVTSVQGSAVWPVMLINPQSLSPPVNLHYTTDPAKRLILRWSRPQTGTKDLLFQVRLFSGIRSEWKSFSANDTQLPLADLSKTVLYTAQVRSQGLRFQDHWSNWSQPLYLCLSGTCYMPEVVFTSPGSEVTVYCSFADAQRNATNVSWLLNLREPIPESQYRVINDHVSAVTWRASETGKDIVFCCEKGKKDSCNIPYATVYTTGNYSADIDCQTTVNLVNEDTMVCTWNKNKNFWRKDQLMYQVYEGPCEDMQKPNALTGSLFNVSACSGLVLNHQKECTLKTLRLISCYKMWLEEVGGEGRVKSLPVYVKPLDVLKSTPPQDVQAVVMPNRTMHLAWSNCSDLPGFKWEYKVRYTATSERAISQFLEPRMEAWAEVAVPEPCIAYKVEVCCKMHISGHWSDWSVPHLSVIENSLAPERGPDFWRQLKEDSMKNHVVTLLVKPLPSEDPPRCVDGLVVQHQASGGAKWAAEVSLEASHTFPLRQEPLTVSVMARNSVGVSSVNQILTLTKSPKRQSVKSFTRRKINNTCVELAWTLLPGSPAPLGFVIEWPEPNWELEQTAQAAATVQWMRVPPAERAVYVHGYIYGAEQHPFTLYTLYEDGEGKPIQCISSSEDPAAYMLLMIVAFLAVVLFVTLFISQNQMKKLMWKDVPDPNKCSWAQGVDIRKVENLESLFRHPEGLTACPLLLVSEVVSEAEVVFKTAPVKFPKDSETGVEYCGETPDLVPTKTNIQKSSDDISVMWIKMENDICLSDAVTQPVSGGMTGISETPESSGLSVVSGQSSVTYATVVINDKPCQESSSSDEGNFSANNSDISGSFTGGMWEMDHSVLRNGDADPRHSASYDSVEEFSETEEEEEVLTGRRVSSDLYYLGMGPQQEDEEEHADGDDEAEEEEEQQIKLAGPDSGSLKEDVVLVYVEPSAENSSPLSPQNSTSSFTSQSSPPLYLPQFRTAANKPTRSCSEESALPL